MNARLRSILLTASIVTAGFSAVTYTSCTEEKCKAVVCANGSVCNEGICICPSGYEGPHCETVNRERFRGNWNVTEDGSFSAPAQYSCVIVYGDGVTQLIIKNFNNYFPDDVKARVKGDTMYIDPQTLSGSTVQGIGYITYDKYYGDNGKLVVRYQVQTPLALDNYGLVDKSNPSVWNK